MSQYYPASSNILYVQPPSSEGMKYYLNSKFDQSYDNLLLINLDQLANNSGSSPPRVLDFDEVDAEDFILSTGLSFEGAYEDLDSGISYASFSFDELSNWEGTLGFEANLDFLSGGASNYQTIYLKADTDHPDVLSIERFDHDSIPSEYNVADSVGSYYFLVTFSEIVQDASANNNYFVSEGYSINYVARPTSADMYSYSSDEVLVKVSNVGVPESGSSVPTLGLNRRLEAMDIEAMASRPLAADVDIYTNPSYYEQYPPAAGTPENWYRMDLSHDVSPYALLMKSGSTYQFSSTAFYISDPNPNMTYPQVREIAFLKNADQVDEFFFRTSTAINTDTIEVNFYVATSSIKDLAGNYLSEPETNDTPTITTGTTDAIGAVTEDTAVDGTTLTDLTDTGTITFDDLDLTDAHTVSVDKVSGTLGGTLTFGNVIESATTSAGSVPWTYTVANSATQYLAKDQTTSEVFTVTIDDGNDVVTQDVTVTVTGTNDATNDVITIDDETIASDGTAATRIDPPASGGFDTLKITLAGDVTVDATSEYADHYYLSDIPNHQGWDSYEFNGSNFSRYEINADTVTFYGITGVSDVVALYQIGDNEIRLEGSAPGDIVTDVIDYSALTDHIRVDLSDANDTQPYAEVEKIVAAPGSPVDRVYGAEGVVGGSGDDEITGNHRDNILVGGLGDDTLSGGSGRDILEGGGGFDRLEGGLGQDILIDLADGAWMVGGEDDRAPGSSAPKDIFVVRSDSTIDDYTTTKSGAGLAGRAVGNINDIIVFNVSMSELAAQLDLIDGNFALSSAVMSEITRNIQINVANIDSNAYWEVSASTYFMDGNTRIDLELGDVSVKAQVGPGQGLSSGQVLTVVPLDDDNYFDQPSVGDVFSEEMDYFVLDNLIPEISSSLNGEESINLSFALEAVRDGTVRADGGNLMVGDFAKNLRIFNPGEASETIYGSRDEDVYEFLVQDFRTPSSSSIMPQEVGDDIIRDTGGVDKVLFSGLDLDSIEQLTFEAVKVGREKGNYSLKTNYSQTEYGIVNEGSFTWTGHFREGFDMQLETITLGEDKLSLAQNVFKYNNLGDLLSATPIQQALEGEDTIMVGKSGRVGDDNIFKLKSKENDSIEQTDLFIWGIDSANDVIDLSDFISGEDPIRVRNLYDPINNPMAMNKFEVDLNNNDAAYELTIHFMGAFSGDSSTLEEMIARANT